MVCCVGGLFCCVRAHGRVVHSVTSVRSCKDSSVVGQAGMSPVWIFGKRLIFL